MELNGAVLNVNIPCVTSRKTAFREDNKDENEYRDNVTALSNIGEIILKFLKLINLSGCLNQIKSRSK